MEKKFWLIIGALIIVILLVLALLPTDEDKYLKEVTMSEVQDKIKNKEDFILYIKQTNCEHCKKFTPRFASVLHDYKLTAYVLNLSNLTEEDNALMKEVIGEIDGTPTTYFYQDGKKSMITIDGEQSKDRIRSKLKSAGFVKEEK